MSAVTSDNRAGGRKVAEFLLAGRHEKIGFIAGWEGASTQRDREAGFVEGLRAQGVALHARQVGNFLMEEARVATLRMFDPALGPDRPDAVFVANDHMALSVMDTLRHEMGLRVPEDVSVVGYDDAAPASWPAYDLTTVRQPASRMVGKTVEILLSKIETPQIAAQRIEIDGPLVVRGSARIPEGWKT